MLSCHLFRTTESTPSRFPFLPRQDLDSEGRGCEAAVVGDGQARRDSNERIVLDHGAAEDPPEPFRDDGNSRRSPVQTHIRMAEAGCPARPRTVRTLSSMSLSMPCR